MPGDRFVIMSSVSMCGTLEWSVPSPPPHHNFDVIPVVQRGPHEYANPEVAAKLGRDWIGQAEDGPESGRSDDKDQPAEPEAASA